MAAEYSTRLLHEFIAKGAKQIAREQTTDGILDQITLHNIREGTESTVKEQARILGTVNVLENGEMVVAGLTQAEHERMVEALILRTGQTIFEAENVPTRVTFSRNNENMCPTVTLDVDRKFFLPISTQIGCIVVESVTLVLRLIGINLQEIDNTKVKLAIGNAKSAVMKYKELRGDVDQILTDQENPNTMGKDILMLVINMYARDRLVFFFEIVKSLLVRTNEEQQAVRKNDWYKIVGQISAFIGMVIATANGPAKIGCLAMEVGDFAYLLIKFADLERLRAIRVALANELGAAIPETY